jgi:hypothetical protein
MRPMCRFRRVGRGCMRGVVVIMVCVLRGMIGHLALLLYQLV